MFMNDESQPKKIIHTEATINVNSVSGDARVTGTYINKLHANEAHIYEAVRPILSPQERRNRQLLLDKVEQFWVKGVLEKSLYKLARVELGLENAPGAVVNPWEKIIQQPDQPDQMMPLRKPIVEVFNDLHGSMLILGAPGSGKTTLLLELAQALIERANQEEQHPIPVVFNLSSWASNQQPLKEWLVRELNLRYEVPQKVGRAWVDADFVLPLLDGLDEMAAEYREGCIQAINVYRQQEAMVPLVVCTRVDEYEAVMHKLRLQGAVRVQPLGKEQVEDYLQQLGKPMAGVRALLRDDSSLLELLDTPLMLAVVALTYRDKTPQALRTVTTIEARRQNLWMAYIEHMFERRGGQKDGQKEEVMRRLAWLAFQMREHNQSVYYIEGMEATWLKAGLEENHRLVFGFAAAILHGLLWTPIGGLPAFLSGLIWGFGYGLMFYKNGTVRVEKLEWSRTNLWWVGSLAFGSMTALAAGMTSGVFGAFIGGVIGAIIGGIVSNIQPKETLLDKKPNQAMRTSLKIALMFMAVTALGFGLFSFLLIHTSKQSDTYKAAGTILLLMSLLGTIWAIGMQFGLSVTIYHYTLRWLLARQGSLPFRDRELINLLDYAVDRILLRRVGGGWIFVHRLLLEHLADREGMQESQS
jgi:energy-coupling factor transporter ATP-binding protein EcfA2